MRSNFKDSSRSARLAEAGRLGPILIFGQLGSSRQHAAAAAAGGPKCKCVQHNWVLLFLVNPSGPGLNSPPSTNLVAFQAFAINGIFDDFFGCCQQDQFSVVVMFQKKRKKNQLDPDLIIFKDFFCTIVAILKGFARF